MTLRTTAVLFMLAAAPALASQDAITAAFATQQRGATLAQVRAQLAPRAGDDAADFALGALDVLLSGEALLQSAHRHGFLGTFNRARGFAGPRAEFLAWIGNDAPAPTTHDDFRAALAKWTSDLARAETTLADAEGDFSCAIDLAAIRFDLNADGATTSAESLRAFFNLLPPRVSWENGRRAEEAWLPAELTVAFDRGDAAWLRGYCRLLMAAGEWALAHDTAELFDHTAHIFFPKAQITYDYLPGSTWSLERMTGMPTPAPFDVTDVLVFFGNMRLPVAEPERLVAALEHLRAAVPLGKAMWAAYDAETDNDREWIPNPNQTAAFADVEVDATMRDAWLLFLDEADDILHSRKVLRFWRGDGSRGIDLPRVFTEPRDFDLLYWVQGSAAAPYLRAGEFTTPGTWAQLNAVFDRRVFRYAFWFN